MPASRAVEQPGKNMKILKHTPVPILGQVKKTIELRRTKVEHLIMALVVVLFLTMPLFAGPYPLAIMMDIGFYAIVTMGLILLMGQAGQLSLGQAVFFGLGAYSSAILTTQHHLAPWLALMLAAIITGSIAAGIGRAVLRLRGIIVSGVTLVLNLIFFYLVLSLVDLTGGANGIINIPSLSPVGVIPDSLFDYYFLWIVAFLLLAFSLNLVNSRTGRALRTMNILAGGGEETAQVLGVNVMKYKVQVFTLSAVYASIAGSIYAHHIGCIEPEIFGAHLSLLVAIMAIVGGMASPWGAFLGAGLLTGLTELLGEFASAVVSGPTGAYELIAYGIILMAVLRFLPQGLIPLFQRLMPQRKRSE